MMGEGSFLNQIITIGREFGSGGREFGKRLAEELGYAYYDREIMEEISKRTRLAESYIHQIVERTPGIYYPITVGKTLHGAEPDYLLRQYTSVYAEQANTIRDMAAKSDCVIVGRCADYILRDENPLRLFIYADMPSRLKRCREKNHEDDGLNDRQLERKIRHVDRNRARYYEYYTGRKWGDRNNYDLLLNTSSMSIKSLVHSLAELLRQDWTPDGTRTEA